MSKGGTTVARRLPDGRLVRVLPDGNTEPFPPDRTDWETVRAMSDGEVEALAQSDPDNPPVTPQREARLKRVPQVKVMRRAMGLTQEDFAARFRIPLGTLVTGSRANPSRIRLCARTSPSLRAIRKR
jgi:putative transcriptional regulator